MARKNEFVTAQPTPPASPAEPARAPMPPQAPRANQMIGGSQVRPNPAIVTSDSRFRVTGTRQPPKFSNLPVESDRGRAMRIAAEEAVAKQAAARAANAPAAGKTWFMFGPQRAEGGGFNLHVQYFEGDKKVKEVVHRRLSPMALHEQMALHMVAMRRKLGI